MKNNISSRELEELKKVNKYNEKSLELLNNDYPIQYIIGYVDFYGIKIKVNESTLIPRYETEYLIEKTMNYLKEYNITTPKILDICTGSGAIGITLKSLIPKSDVTITDISSLALTVARENIKEHNLNIKVIESDLFSNIPTNKYDLIISNPPYVMTTEVLPKNVTYEPSLALYSEENGTHHIKQILLNMDKYLNDTALIAIEINEKSEKELSDFINEYLNKTYKYKFEKDLAGKTRYLFIFKNMNKK